MSMMDKLFYIRANRGAFIQTLIIYFFNFWCPSKLVGLLFFTCNDSFHDKREKICSWGSIKVTFKTGSLQSLYSVCFIHFRLKGAKWRLWNLGVLKLTFFQPFTRCNYWIRIGGRPSKSVRDIRENVWPIKSDWFIHISRLHLR